MTELPEWAKALVQQALDGQTNRARDDFIAAVTAVANYDLDTARAILEESDQELLSMFGVIACGALLEGRSLATGEPLEALTAGFAQELRAVIDEWKKAS